MALSANLAWVSSAATDSAVPAALVLGESIRQTKTRFKTAVITSLKVSLQNRVALKRVFDQVVLLESIGAPDNFIQDQHACSLAKAYVFDLNFYRKCVYVSPNTLFLENADQLFQGNDHKFDGIFNPETGVLDISVFAARPDEQVWNSIWEKTGAEGKDITDEWLSTWLINQRSAMKTGQLPKGILTHFDLSQGKLLSDQTHSPVIHFVLHELKEWGRSIDLAQHLKKLEKLDMGQHEKLIVGKWMETHLGLNTPSPYKSLGSNHPSAATLMEKEYGDNEPIAILGMSCRFPGANSLHEFWDLLASGDEGIREPPLYRWKKEHVIRVSQQDRKTHAGFLSVPVDEFDARFFGVSPKEAAYMDPQTRLLHEVLWESLEDAGIDPLSLYGTHTGIFTGSWMNDYKDIVTSSAEKDFFRTYMGNSIGAAAARLSFLLGLTGPSIATESGCSSAIVALDLAVKSLRNGETNLALAGGVNLLLHPFNSNIMEYVISPNGRCKTFDANADGFGRAEGCGVLVLKRMSDAMRDGDNIWALIRGSAISQEGLSRSMGTPTVHCESLAMKLALEDACVNPESVSFVETHGTGTAVGDPMEVAAIAKAYHSPARKEPLVIGSVKTNVGHTESCSGITGIMKAVLAMQHELIPKHRNLETLNPEIFLDSIPAIIPTEAIPWPRVSGQPRICGVSSFGITGTDGHVIIEEAPDLKLPKFTLGMERPLHLIKISGKSREALEELLSLYENQFSASEISDLGFANAAYSANVGRASFNHRTFLLGRDHGDAVKLLKDKKYLQGEVKDGHRPQICFLFTGQGSQYMGMAKTLYDTSPVFRLNFDSCDRILKQSYNLSIKKVLWESEPNSKELSRTIYSQTSIFCIEYCLLKLWQSWGIKPDYVLGHSLGEFAAAVAAEVLTFQDALMLVTERSILIDKLPRGSMLVIKASKPEVENHLVSSQIELDFAAINHPDQTVLAGDNSKISAFLAYLKGQEVKAIILEATHAFHSRHMDPMLEQYRKVASKIQYKQGNPEIQYVSGVEGRLITDATELGSDYWVRHTREKVSFINACAAMKESGCQDFLEVGPQPILSSFVMMNNEGAPLNCLPSLRRGTDDWETILTSLGKLYLLGYQVDWEGYDKPYVREKVSLPFHPFHRRSFWLECTNDNATMIHPLIGYSFKNASALSIFQNDLILKTVPYLKDHCIGKRIVFPGAGFTEMCLSAGFTVANGLSECLEQPSRAVTLENVRIEAPLEIREGKACRLQTIVDLPEKEQLENSDSKSGFRVRVYHQNVSNEQETGKWVLHASSTFLPVASTKECLARWNPKRIPEIISKNQPISTETFYKQMDEHGLRFGESFRMIRKFWAEKQVDCEPATDEIVAEMKVPTDWNKYLLHPLIIDAVFQTGILTAYHYKQAKLKVPVQIGQLAMFPGMSPDSPSPFLYLHCWKSAGNYYLFISTPEYKPVCYVEDVELLDTNVRTIESVLEQQCSPIPEAWEEIWKPIPSPFDCSVNGTVDPQPILEQLIVPPTPDSDIVLYNQTNRLLYFYIVDAFHALGWQPDVGAQITDISVFCEKLGIRPEFRQLVHFYLVEMEKEAGVVAWNSDFKLWTVTDTLPEWNEVKAEIQRLEQVLLASSHKVVATIYKRVAENLTKILKGNESALALLFPQEPELQQYSADWYYQKHPGREETSATVQEILTSFLEKQVECKEFLASSRAVYRILEVGAGTGSMSAVALRNATDVLGSDNFQYFYTDISQSFFIKAEKRFEDYKQNIKFALFNVESSPLSQGIPLECFDMVVCTDVLHATRNLQETLVHLRQTLKPGGILFFTETLTAARDITFVFGLLEGYWRFEDLHRRPEHCCISGNAWKEALVSSGFGYVHCVNSYAHDFGIITAVARDNVKVENLQVATRLLDHPETAAKQWVIFCRPENLSVIRGVANMLVASGFCVRALLPGSQQETVIPEMELLFELGVTLEHVTVEAENGSEIQRVISGEHVCGVVYAWGLSLSEIDQRNVALPFMHLAKALVGLVKPPPLYVVTQGIVQATEDSMITNPTAATLLGMTKSLKNENPSTLVRIVDLEPGCAPELVAKHLLFELAMCRGTKELQRAQVAYRGNVRYEPRMLKVNVRKISEEMKLPLCATQYQLVLPGSRLIQDLEYEAQEEEIMGEAEVEVKVKAYALNFRDIFSVLKPSAQFENLNAVGLDFSGVVSRAGPGAKFGIGERVFGANFIGGLLPSHLVIADYALLKIPDNMTFYEAATMPAVFLTAYHCLITVARMKKEDTVLIHTGSGGVGLAAIQLAKHVGANIITTAGNPRKRAYLRSLGIQHVFHSRDTSYEQDILRVTNGRGVDIVLNSITGPGIKEATLGATAENGRWVEMSKLSVWTPEEVKALRSDVDYSIVDLTVLEKNVFTSLLERIEELLHGEKIRSVPFVKFDALFLRQAMQYLQKAKHIGKVVVTMPEVEYIDGGVKTSFALFDTESTYLITGGLGGIGFEVCKWMLEMGATDIVLTGRNPPKPEIQQEIQALREKGYQVVVMLGDVGNYSQCKSLVTTISSEMKPLRGIMHCAGVLIDNAYINQSWDQFVATFAPKVDGTWNLHNLTRNCPLEHFVMYSSITALLGTLGQPNHAGANSFEDAFVHYRHSLGLPATTINWGQWAQVGCAKDLNFLGVTPVSVKRMLKGLEMSLRTQQRQVCFSEFESFQSVLLLSPLSRGYLDERVLQQLNKTSSQTNQALNAEQFWKDMDAEESSAGKIVAMQGYLKKILRAALRLEPSDALSETANLQELGVDSLMMIELKNSIQSLLGSRLCLTTGLLKDCNTIQLLANAIVGKLMEGDSSGLEEVPLEPLPSHELKQLMANDSILPEDITVSPQLAVAVRPSQISTILVTGATGQLGSHIVANIIQDYPSISRIICLTRGTEESLKNILNSLDVSLQKVECVSGNITQTNLGVAPAHYNQLCGDVDAVVHCAAKMHLLEQLRANSENVSGTDCRSVNLMGTLNILRFASATKLKHVYYPSTLLSAVFSNNSNNVLSDTWPEPGEIDSLVTNKVPGLQSCKFLTEILLEQANKVGIPCKVFRFPWMAGHSKTGRVELESLYILRFLSYLRLGAIPMLLIPANFLPVDLCAQLSLYLFLRDDTPCEIFNLSHPQPQLEQEFVGVADQVFGKKLDILEENEFKEKLKQLTEKGLEGQLQDHQKISQYFADAGKFATGYLNSPNTFFRSTKVSGLIAGYGTNFLPTMEYLKNDLHYLKSTGLLDKLGI